MNLAKEYIKYMDSGITFDEFFDKCKVPEEARSGFAVASILKQAREIVAKEGKK